MSINGATLAARSALGVVKPFLVKEAAGFSGGIAEGIASAGTKANKINPASFIEAVTGNRSLGFA